MSINFYGGTLVRVSIGINIARVYIQHKIILLLHHKLVKFEEWNFQMQIKYSKDYEMASQHFVYICFYGFPEFEWPFFRILDTPGDA